jgi:voltage-gated potassium channel
LIESLFTLAVMMAGMFLFATIIGNVSTMVDELNENEGVLQTKLLLMTRMMRQNQLPHELEDRVTNYISYQYKNHQGFDDFQMLQTLPAGLRTDIMLELTRSMIERVPFFHGEAEGFVRSLVDRLKPQIASAGETLICAGQVQMEMYFVQRGEFDIFFGSPPVIVGKLRQGDYFGEALLSAKPCASTIQARTFCDLFTLARRALVEVLTYYPETEKKMHELVAKRLEEDRLKGKEAMLMSKYGQKWVQQLRKLQDRKLYVSRSPSSTRPRHLRAAPSSNLTASPSKKSFKAITEQGMSSGAITAIRLARAEVSPSKKSFKAITEKGMSSGAITAIRLARSKASEGASTLPLSPIKVAPAGSNALPLVTLTNSAGDGKDNEQLIKAPFSATFMTRQAADSYKVGVVMDKTDASFTKDSQKSIQSQGALRSLTPWLARAIGLARARSQEDYCYVVLPYGLTRQLWLLLMLLATTWNIFAVPYSISFIWGYYKLMHGAAALIPFSIYAPVLCVDIFADLIFVADVLLSQRLVFVDAQGGLEKDARVIRRQFFKTGLPRALSAVVALDIIMLAAFDWCPILRLNRLVNFDKFFSLQLDMLQTFQRSTKSSPQHTSLRIFRLFFSFLAISHYIACLSTIVAAFGTPLDSISYALEGSTQYPHGVVIESAFALYVRAIYFAVSNLTGLGRDVKPLTVAEYLLTCGVWSLGIFVFAYTIGTAGVLISNSDAGETRFNKKRTSVFNYLANQKLPTEMQTRAFNFFETAWARTKGVDIQEVVSDLNTALSIDVMSHLCRDAVKNVPVFALKGDQFISSIVQVLSFHAFPQGEWLMRKGTIGNEMFFILKGQVDIIVDEKLMFVIKTLQVGDFVGEGALFQGKGKRGAACCARTSCETMVLSKDGFAHVLQLWPDIEQELLDASKKRQEDTQLVVNALERRIQRDPKIGDSGRETPATRPSRLRANSVAPRRSQVARPRITEAGGSSLQGSK